MAKKKKTVTADTLLRALDKVVQTSKYYQSRESGKRFYDQGNFPSLLQRYIVQSGRNVRENAYRFGMSPGTLESILAGGRLSDNMLFRIRSVLAADVAAIAKNSIYPGDWRKATPIMISAAISDVSDKLLFLKKVVEASNFLNSEESPIDKIQVAQLIALLGSTLAALQAPFVDKKHTSGFFRWLGRLAKSVAEKGVEKVVVHAMGDAAHAGADLIHHLSSHPGTTDLGNIIT